MAEQQLTEITKVSGTLVGLRETLHMWAWDCGPEEPEAPTPPDPPEGREGTPIYDLQKIQFARKLAAYQEALLKYETDRDDHRSWWAKHGGPTTLSFWSVDLADALENDGRAVAEGRQARRRYFVYDAKSPTHGLPAGLSPGRGHHENIARQIAGQIQAAAARQSDPQFGQGN
jgi:hypothetical protein